MSDRMRRQREKRAQAAKAERIEEPRGGQVGQAAAPAPEVVLEQDPATGEWYEAGPAEAPAPEPIPVSLGPSGMAPLVQLGPEAVIITVPRWLGLAALGFATWYMTRGDE